VEDRSRVASRASSRSLDVNDKKEIFCHLLAGEY
jgi:hypothetical protein